MDFLKEILGEELFNQLQSRLNEHNGNEANRDKQIKLANLGGGNYVSKGKYDTEIEKLNNLLSGKSNELKKANDLIEQLKKGTKGDEELQGKISKYETETIPNLQKQLQQTRIEAAVKVALLSEKALDVPYLAFKVNEKLQEQGKTLELDENENIKGWDEVISSLKTEFPAQFEAASTNKEIVEIPLPGNDKKDAEPTSLEDALKMQYESKTM